jgi:LuxR family maltose regulon positive regulatory protein
MSFVGPGRHLPRADLDRLHPAPVLLERQARQRTAHAALIAEILDLLAGNRPAPSAAGPQAPLSRSEIRVPRYLPTRR